MLREGSTSSVLKGGPMLVLTFTETDGQTTEYVSGFEEGN
jgi:hypothetical protein